MTMPPMVANCADCGAGIGDKHAATCVNTPGSARARAAQKRARAIEATRALRRSIEQYKARTGYLPTEVKLPPAVLLALLEAIDPTDEETR